MRTDQALAAGTRLRGGHYKVTGVLGAGGFGIVYEAKARGRKPVAIKELFPGGAVRRTVLGLWTRRAVRPTAGWPDLERAMRDEFRVVRTLKHPNIVRVAELFGENGTLYLVMEKLDGETLQDRLARSPDGLSERDVVPAVLALADALHYAHKKGVLHRDVKPGNVFLARGGRPVLLDFGLAGGLDAAASRSKSGTDSYMAPEQVQGHAQGAAADVYGLAATAYHALVGAPPQAASDRLRADRLTPPAAENPRVSAATSDAILRALALDPGARTPTCKLFAADLGGGIVAPARSSGRREHHHWPWLRGLAVAAGLGVVAAAWSGCPANRPAAGQR